MSENAKLDANFEASSLAVTEDTKEPTMLRVSSITGELLVDMDLTPRSDTQTSKTKKVDENYEYVSMAYDETNEECVPFLVDQNSNLLVDTIIN